MEWSIGPLLMITALGIVVFVALREFFCWYFKINERRDLLKRIAEASELPKEGTPKGEDSP